MGEANLTVLINYIHSHGGVVSLMELLEALQTHSQKEVARALDMKPQRLSFILKHTVNWVPVLKPELREALDKIEQTRRERYEREKRIETRIERLASCRQEDKEETGD